MPLQTPNLDDRSFEQLFAEAKARIPVHTPEWSNFNDSDPGITVVQLFAFMTENLLYRSNRIPEANRVKFLELLDIPLQPASAGRGLVVFSNDKGPIQPYPFDAGLELRAGKVPFRTRTAVCVLPVTAAVYYKKPRTLDPTEEAQYKLLYDSFLQSDSSQLKYYQSTSLEAPAAGKPSPVVDLADGVGGTIDRSLWIALLAPQGIDRLKTPAQFDAVRRAIAKQTLALGIYPAPECAGKTLKPQSLESQSVQDPGLVIEIAQPDPDPKDPLSGVGLPGDSARYARLYPEYAENVLERPGVVMVDLPDYPNLRIWDFDPSEEGTADYPPLVEDAGLKGRIVTWLRVRLPQADPTQVQPNKQQARLTWVGVNAARVIQALPVTGERLGVGTGAPGQSLKVANTPVIADAEVDAESGATPFTLEIQQLDGTWQAWTKTDDLYGAGPDDKVFSLDPESGIVSFGSGLRGSRPPLGQTIRVSYEYGGGLQGIVAIGAINKSAALPAGLKVGNSLPTWGASSGETAADGERNIPRFLRHRDRAVTATDFRDLALRTPGVDVGRAEVLPLFNPELSPTAAATQRFPGMVTVMVIPRTDATQPDAPVPDRLFLNAVCDWLDERRLITTEVHVRGPQYVAVWASVGLAILPGYLRESVTRAVQAALHDYLSPLVGGPPTTDPNPADAVCPDQTTSNDPCPTSKGWGWPLGTPVRVQDLEAVATRVTGVRYVDSIKLGALAADGASVTETDSVPIAGLQLPHLVGLSAREGPAEDIAALLGQVPTPPNLKDYVAVPVLPKKC